MHVSPLPCPPRLFLSLTHHTSFHLTRASLMVLRVQCYVDAATCARESKERVFRSDYFDFDSGVDVYYSYSTCNSTAQPWLEVVDDVKGHPALKGSKTERDASVGIVRELPQLTRNRLASAQSPSTPMCPPITSRVSG